MAKVKKAKIKHAQTAPFIIGIGSVLAALALIQSWMQVYNQQAVPIARAETGTENTLRSQINTERYKRGLANLNYNTTAYNCAKNWANKQASTNGPLAHNPNLDSCLGSETRFGEIVGNGNSSGLVSAWMGSCAHRNIMLDPGYEVDGVGFTTSSSGSGWAAGVFARYGSYFTAIKNIRNCSFDPDFGLITTNVAFGAVRERGKWYGHASSGTKPAIGTTQSKSPDVDDNSHIVVVNDPNPGQASVTQLIDATPGGSYWASGYALYVSGPTSQRLYMDILDASYNVIKRVSANATRGSGWQTVTTPSASAPSNAKYVRVFVYGSNDLGWSSRYYWDSISIEGDFCAAC